MLYGKNLAKGDKNGSVADLQRRLNHQHFKCVGAADGHFGDRTKLAVVRFQDIYGLSQDGVVGPITMSKLQANNGQVSAHFNIFHDVLYSRGNGDLIFRGEVIHRLERLRAVFGRAVIVNSGYRDPRYNARVGGARRSQHMYGAAADIVVVGKRPTEVAAVARRVGFTFIATYSGFTHCDIR